MEITLEGKKLYAALLVFCFVIISFITLIIARNQYKHVLNNTINENKITAHLLSALIYEHQKATISILESYAQRHFFVDAVKKKSLKDVIPHLQSMLKSNTEIDVPFITDTSGTLWANYPTDRTGFGKNLAFRDWYKGVSKYWKPYISSVYRMVVLDKGIAVAVSVPVFDINNNVVGILSAAQRTAFIATFIKDKTLDPEKTITLLDQEGNIIFSNAVPYEKEITKYPDAQVREKAVGGVLADIETENVSEKGDISYISIAPVRGLGWSLIIGHGKDTILKSLYGFFILYTATGVFIFLTISVSLAYFRKEYIYRKTKELLTSEEKYRTLFDETLEGICLADPETGIIINCNKALATLVDREQAYLIGQPQTILHPPQQGNAAVSPTFKRHLGDKEGQILETQVITETGVVREVEIKANLINLQGRKVLQGIFRDITERKQADAALKKSEEKYRNLFDNAVEGVYQSTPEGRLITANMAFAKMFGYESPEEFINTVKDIGLQMYANPDDRKRAVGIFLETGHIKDFECQMRRKDGSVFWVRYDGRLTKTAEGVPCFEGFIIDITDRKQAEVALEEMNEELIRSNKDLEQFAYVASHDLQEPLRMVSSYTQLLAQRYRDKLDKDAQDFINYAVDGANRMQRLIVGLLEFSRIGTRGKPFESVDLHDAMGEAVVNLHSKISETNAIVSTEELPKIHADRTQMVLIFQNLIENAIKFRKKDELPHVHTSAERVGQEWIISLKDNGIGIDPQYFNRIFTIFQRLHSRQEYPGDGIGLALCQRILIRHGGRIWVESSLGEGSTFRFTMKA